MIKSGRCCRPRTRSDVCIPALAINNNKKKPAQQVNSYNRGLIRLTNRGAICGKTEKFIRRLSDYVAQEEVDASIGFCCRRRRQLVTDFDTAPFRKPEF